MRRISREGHLATVARNLGSHPMGLWLDNARNTVYVAVYGRNAVVRIGPDGRVEEVARSLSPWAPSGVLVDPGGALWVLEYSTSNQARVRRIARNGRATVF